MIKTFMNLLLKILAIRNTWTVKGRSYPHLTHKVMRLQTCLPLRTPTVELTQAINGLSVQLTAYTTLATVHRCIASKQLRYMADKLQLRTNEGNATFPLRHENTLRIQSNLTLSRGGFFCRVQHCSTYLLLTWCGLIRGGIIIKKRENFGLFP